jgi:hypothetical protein
MIEICGRRKESLASACRWHSCCFNLEQQKPLWSSVPVQTLKGCFRHKPLTKAKSQGPLYRSNHQSNHQSNQRPHKLRMRKNMAQG